MLQIRSATLGEPYLPPGSLSLLGLLRRRKDDHYFLTCQQHYGPIFKTLWSNQLAVCVIGLELGQRLLAEHGESVTPITIRIDSLVSKGFLRSMSGPEHEHYRHVLAASLEPSVVEPWDPMLRRLVHSTLTNLAVEQRELAGPSRHLQQSFDKIATSALLMLVYGATHDSNTFRSLHAAYHRFGPRHLAHEIGPRQREAFASIRLIVRDLIGSMDARPSEYKRQTVLHRVVRESARSAVDEAIVGNLIYMVEMGRHDLRGLMQWILKYLTDHPSIVEELQEYHHAESCMPTLAEACVLETLRLDQAEVLNRSVNKEFVFEGHRIPAGCAVRILLRESHRDSNVFVNPDLFDPHRFIEKTYKSSQYAPFGIGGHRCIAAGLVVRIATIFVEELASGFSWLKTNDGPRHRGPFHWEPSPEFSIELRSRDSAERREKS